MAGINMRTAIIRNKGHQRGGSTVGMVILIVSTVLAATSFSVSYRSCRSGGANESKAASSKGAAGAAAADFRLKDLSGKELKLSDYKGQVVVLNFWATWCGPCRAEIPSFVKLRQQYRERGLEVIGISLDEVDLEGVAGFASRFGIDYPIVMGTRETVEAYGPMNAIPTTYFIDRQGRTASRHLGTMSFDEIEREVKPLLF